MKIAIVITALSTLLLVAGFNAATAYAHVEVSPDEVGVATHDQPFKMVVPNEKDDPTVAVRLVVPEGLSDVTPQAKPGWKIEVKKDSEGDNAKVAEISWTGGTIANGQFDEFAFTAQPPATETTLTWKAYQTYQDGTVVSWDQDDGASSSETSGSASHTKVINDLPGAPQKQSVSTLISLVALILSIAALVLNLRKRSV